MAVISTFLTDLSSSIDKMVNVWNNGSSSIGEKIIYNSLGFIFIGIASIIVFIFLVKKNYPFWNWTSLKKEWVKILLCSLILGLFGFAVIISGFLLTNTLHLLLFKSNVQAGSKTLFLLSIAYLILTLSLLKIKSKPKTIYPHVLPAIFLSFYTIFILISLSSLIGLLRMSIPIKSFNFWLAPPFFMYLIYVFLIKWLEEIENPLEKKISKISLFWKIPIWVVLSGAFYLLIYFL